MPIGVKLGKFSGEKKKKKQNFEQALERLKDCGSCVGDEKYFWQRWSKEHK